MNDHSSGDPGPLATRTSEEAKEQDPLFVSGNSGLRAETEWSKTRYLLLGFGFIMLVLALYWRTLFTNFVYDDWWAFGELHRSGTWTTVLRHFDPHGSVVYRPLGWLYFALLFETFGVAPLPFHILNVIFLSVNGTLISWIGTRVTGRLLMGVLGGVTYLVLMTLHLDTLLWMVGFFDIGVSTFSLLSFFFLMRQRALISAVLMMCALFTKEAAAFLPPLLFLWVLLAKRPLRTLTYHAIGAVVYVGIKLVGLVPFALQHDNAYAADFSVETIATHTMEHLQWLISAFIPRVRFDALPGLGFLIVLFFVVAWAFARHRSPGTVPAENLWFFGAWVVLALLPVLVLRSQAVRYYDVHAAVPTALLASIMLVEIKERLVRKWGTVIVIVFLAVIGSANVLEVNRMFAEGMRQVIVNDGYFHLVKRVAAVDAIYDSLMAQGRPLKSGTVVLINGVPLDAVGESQALQLWFRDSTLTMRNGARSDFQQSGRVPDSILFIDLEAESAPLPAQPSYDH